MMVAGPSSEPESALVSKINDKIGAVESRIPEVKNKQLQELLRYEVELLRRELELAQPAD